MKKDRPAAWGLVLASVKLQYCIFFLIPVLALKRFRLLAWALGLGAIVLVATAINVSIDSFLQYPAWISRIESSGTGGVAAAAMVNIQGLCLTFLPSRLAFWTSACAFVMALVYLSSLWYRGRQLDESGQRFLLATTIAIALLTSMHTHFHDCILLAAAVLSLKSVQIVCRDPSKEYGLWFFLLINYPMLSWICYIYQDQGGMTVLAVINLLLAVSGALYSEKLIKQCPQAISSAPPP